MIARTQTTTYRTTSPAIVHARRTAFVPGLTVPVRPVAVPQRRAAAGDVRDLIDAAGPLSLRDIAGGTGIAPHEAAQIVAHMVAHGVLRRDEWGRHSLRATLAGD